jgi:outer membrane receptor for ferrienterochelin and colicins
MNPLAALRVCPTALRGVAVACALMAITSARAQAPTPAPADQKVEISAQPLTDTEQRRRDPVAKTVVGRDEIEKYGDTNLSDVLKRLPGVNMSGGNPRLRGLGSGYTLVLVNGEPAPPGFSLDNLSPSQVERPGRGWHAEHHPARGAAHPPA